MCIHIGAPALTKSTSRNPVWEVCGYDYINVSKGEFPTSNAQVRSMLNQTYLNTHCTTGYGYVLVCALGDNACTSYRLTLHPPLSHLSIACQPELPPSSHRSQGTVVPLFCYDGGYGDDNEYQSRYDACVAASSKFQYFENTNSASALALNGFFAMLHLQVRGGWKQLAEETE